MSEVRFNQNQTQFTVDGPMLELPVQPTPELPTNQIKPPGKRLPKWVPILAVVLAIVIVAALIIAVRNRQPDQSATDTTATPSIVRQLTPLEQRLEDARQLLREANPTTLDLPFPPIDMKLRIDVP
jgi:hypothetical protein